MTGSRRRVLDYLDSIGYKDMTVAELIKQLAELPPMMKIFALDHTTDEKPMWVNGISIIEAPDESSDVLQLYIHVSDKPEKNILPDVSYEELLAQKKEQALEMAREKQNAQRF